MLSGTAVAVAAAVVPVPAAALIILVPATEGSNVIRKCSVSNLQ
jgi:hypothetical protein